MIGEPATMPESTKVTERATVIESATGMERRQQ
jgi:hypothetical protein